MKKNFEKLTDVLLIKFGQVEDNKQAVRDMLNYQKYFYPLQMQAIIGENMMNLEAGMNDQAYVQFQQKRYDELLKEIDGHEQKMKDEPDREMCDHLDQLDGKDLKSAGWTCVPMANVAHDFVSPLLDAYIKDLGARMADHRNRNSGFAKTLRKGIRMKDAESMINVQYQKIVYLKKQADEKEQQLELARRLNEHNKKTKKLITEKMEFKKSKAFGRQNSYMP